MDLSLLFNHSKEFLFFVVNLSIVFLILIINEFYVSKKIKHYEYTRKFAHVLIGTFVAFWPFYISYQSIRIISLLFILVTIFSKFFNLFNSIHSIDRFSLGEISFGIAVGLATFLTNNIYIFSMAILIMSISDGLAAIVGVKWGRTNQYHILSSTKSIVGTAIFFISSLIIVTILNTLGHLGLSLLAVMLLAFSSLVVENISFYGLDNLLIPLLVIVVASLI